MATKKKKTKDQRIIANMGLFWSREKVRWKGNAGIGPARLAGVRAVSKKSGEVDFWAQTGIYALYDASYALIYVGQAGLTDQSCVGNRLKQHIKDDLAGRWEMFSWFGLQSVNKTNKLRARAQVSLSTRSQLANVLEGILIEVAEPPMNSQKGRFGKRVERYAQIDDSVDHDAEIQEKTFSLIKTLGEDLKDTKQRLAKALQQCSTRLDRKVTDTRRRMTKSVQNTASRLDRKLTKTRRRLSQDIKAIK